MLDRCWQWQPYNATNGDDDDQHHVDLLSSPCCMLEPGRKARVNRFTKVLIIVIFCPCLSGCQTCVSRGEIGEGGGCTKTRYVVARVHSWYLHSVFYIVNVCFLFHGRAHEYLGIAVTRRDVIRALACA